MYNDLDFFFYYNLTQGGKKKPPQQQTGSQSCWTSCCHSPTPIRNHSLAAAAPPASAIVGRAEHRKSPVLEAHAFKQNLEKSRRDQLQMKETALFAHPSKGQTGTEQGWGPAGRSATAPESPGEGVTSTPRALTAPFPVKFLETKDFQQEQPTWLKSAVVKHREQVSRVASQAPKCRVR